MSGTQMVPAITIYEVHKWVLREHGEAKAIQARLHTMDSDVRAIRALRDGPGA